MPIFDRIGRNVYLTTYGEVLVPYAQQIVSAVLEMENFFKSKLPWKGRSGSG